MDDAAEALAIARRVVADAVALVRGVAPARVTSKSNPRDLVTEWDTRVEELVRARLAELSPGVAIVGEEGGGDATGDRWVVDPIDGTVNFAHGLPLWAVTIALERGGAALAGVVSAPELGWEMWAARGGGAYCDGARLRVSAVDTLDGAMLASGFPYDRAETRTNFAEWDAMQCAAGACRRLGAASLDLALVARGMMDGYWEARLHAWDVAAGALMVEEAGGKVSSLTGGPYRSDHGALIASNGRVHDDIVRVLAEVGGLVRAHG
jgi:myo-inositol-1(or 4)-monophosphatase